MNKKGKSVTAKQERAGWLFLIPATVLICIMSFYPIIQAFITSFKTGSSANMKWAQPITYNYTRMFSDKLFMRSVGNTFFYLIVQVPIMLILAILLAQLLNNRDLKTFTVDCSNSVRLRKLVPKNRLFVSESGIRTPEDIEVLRRNGTDAVLIGETLMRSPDKAAALRELRGGVS